MGAAPLQSEGRRGHRAPKRAPLHHPLPRLADAAPRKRRQRAVSRQPRRDCHRHHLALLLQSRLLGREPRPAHTARHAAARRGARRDPLHHRPRREGPRIHPHLLPRRPRSHIHHRQLEARHTRLRPPPRLRPLPQERHGARQGWPSLARGVSCQRICGRREPPRLPLLGRAQGGSHQDP